MNTTSQKGASSKAQVPPAAKTAAAKPPRKLAAGTVEGPKGRKMKDHPQASPHPEVPPEQRQGERRQAQSNAMTNFVASSMAAPAAHAPELSAEQKKQAAFAEAVKKLAAEAGIDPATVLSPAAKQAKAPRADRIVRNNITRPASGTTTGAIWDVADEISMKHNGHPATIAEVRAHAKLLQTNDHTIKTQYARWRAFHGIKGRVAMVQPPAVEGRDDGIENAFKPKQ